MADKVTRAERNGEGPLARIIHIELKKFIKGLFFNIFMDDFIDNSFSPIRLKIATSREYRAVREFSGLVLFFVETAIDG